MAEPLYEFGIEFAANSFTNVTSRFERGNWSSSIVDMFSAPKTGHGLFEFANDDGYMSPGRNENLLPGKTVRLKAIARELNCIDYDFTKAKIAAEIGALFSEITFTRAGATATRTKLVDKYLVLPGASGSYASTPDSVAASVTGDIDFRMKLEPNAWLPAAPQIPIAKWNSAGNQKSFLVFLNTNATLTFYMSVDGSTESPLGSGGVLPGVDGTPLWIRVTRTQIDGVVTFYYSSDGETWTQLGTGVLEAGSGIFDSNTPLVLSGHDVGAQWPYAGKVYYAEVRRGVDGPVVAKFDAEAGMPGSGTILSETEEMWTLNGSASIVGAEIETVAADTPRFDYDPVTLECKGLLIEEARTNVCLRSSEFDNASWTKTRSSISANAIAAPDGTTSADKLVEDSTASNLHYTDQIVAITGGQTYTLSVFAKAGERSRIVLGSFDGTTGIDYCFNLTTGAIDSGAGASASITPMGGGWYRCAVTRSTAGAATTLDMIVYLDNGTGGAISSSYSGDGASGVYIWGAQIETAFPTSYIPTTSATVTRNADAANDTSISDWLNASEGTIVAEYSNLNVPAAGQYPGPMALYHATDNSWMGFIDTGDSGGRSYFLVRENGVDQALVNMAAVPSADQMVRAAAAYKANDFAASRDGGAVVAASLGNVPTVDALRLSGTYDAQFNGHLRRFRYYPFRVTNAELQDLSQGIYTTLTEKQVGLREQYFGGVSTLGTANSVDHASRLSAYNGFSGFGFTAEIDFKVSSLYDWLDVLRPTAVVSGGRAGITMYVNSAGLFTFHLSNTSSTYSTAAPNDSIKINNRYLLHGTRTDSLISLFLNGTCVGTATIPASFQLSNVSSFMFGFQAPGTYYGVKFWNRGLTTNEIVQRTKNINIPSDLFLDLNFLANVTNSGDVLADKSGYNNNVTLANSFSWTSVGSEYSLFYGRVREISHSSRLAARTTILDCADDWDRVGRLTYTTSLFVDTRPASLFTTLMSASNVKSFNADAISDTVGFAWYRDRDSINALHELVQSGNYQLNVDGNGTFSLRGRYAAFFGTAVSTYVEQMDDLSTLLSQDSVINQMRMHTIPRRQLSDVTTLAFLGTMQTIPASSGIGFWVTYQDPFEPSEETPVGSIITPVASTDYYATVDDVGSGTDKTSQVSLQMRSFGASAVVSLYNGGGETVYLQRFQIRGYPIARLPDLAAQYDVNSSQDVFGVRLHEVRGALVQNLDFMQSLSKAVTVERHVGKTTKKLVLTNEWPDVLRNANGDLISVVDSFSGHTSQWQIRSTNHEISLANGLRHTATYHTEERSDFPFLVLDHPTLGKLDDGRTLGV